ncbi:MAG: HAD-IB family phosphatase [Candidatus Lokiarchaeota archaeon]|nr:HAD-IB family phosphatase [Candidatus Lokiarchaeota archaeon]
MAIQLVVFDVDGTLTCHSSIWWRLHEHFGTEEEGRFYFDQYFSGAITYNEWAAFDAGLWKGRKLTEIHPVVESTKLVPGAKQTIHRLKEHGVKVAILSGGLDVLAYDVARKVGIEYVLTNRLLHEDGILSGSVEVNVGWAGKVIEIKRIADHFGVDLKEVAYVGDGRNDISVFNTVGLSIAFRAEDKEVAEAAMIKVQGDDLTDILQHII